MNIIEKISKTKLFSISYMHLLIIGLIFFGLWLVGGISECNGVRGFGSCHVDNTGNVIHTSRLNSLLN